MHLGLVPDGNRRYARKAGISKRDSYLAGVDRALAVVGWCREEGIRHVSAFGASYENFARRPSDELSWLHEALVRFCEAVSRLQGIALHVFGDAAGLPETLPGRETLIAYERTPRVADASLVVHVGANYSGESEVRALLRAVEAHGVAHVARAPGDFLLSAGVPPVDLVVRTGGQQRLSGFLPFQSAYAELWFTSTLWAEFERHELRAALDWYSRQERRLGE
jgi:undecaprenyl diphosphate synthase